MSVLHIILFVLIAIAVFWLVSQAFMYKLTEDVTHLLGWNSSSDGVPNVSGIILHGLVLGLLLLLAAVLLINKK